MLESAGFANTESAVVDKDAEAPQLQTLLAIADKKKWRAATVGISAYLSPTKQSWGLQATVFLRAQSGLAAELSRTTRFPLWCARQSAPELS